MLKGGVNAAADRVSRGLGPVALLCAATLVAACLWRMVQDRHTLTLPPPSQPGPAHPSPLSRFWHEKPPLELPDRVELPKELRGPGGSSAGQRGSSPARTLLAASRDLARAAGQSGEDVGEFLIGEEDLLIAARCEALRTPPCAEFAARLDEGFLALGLPSPVPK